ncbi:hypothetical protein [Nocardioides sp.]|uniref:hypothetical protein n=1 Tax=Nocardioides sp. TaxID=35761 RepID=UPI002C392ADC|nr:hypothetical protein [Nocardioides sp.]HXH79470.1 hypothetical protein [Nocardioides sp.]
MGRRRISGLLVVLLLGAACSADRDSGTSTPPVASSSLSGPSDPSDVPSSAEPATAAPERAVEVTRCDEVRLPEGGVGGADFNLDAAEGLLDINFSDTRRGVHRNISYTVEYLKDPTCRETAEVAQLIARVGPPDWPPVVLGPQGAGPLHLGMTYQEIGDSGAASTVLGSRHDGWPAGCRILHYRASRFGRVPGATLNGTVSPERGLEQLYATSRMITPQGVRIGSSADDVAAAYDLAGVSPGESVTVPASARAVYRIQLTQVVTSISLELRQLGCMR